MTNVTVIGAQWGDEGKGKIVDWLSQRADVVIRFQGGHNAGHTLVIDGKTFKLSLLPSGIARPGKLSILGNGVVIDPWALTEEMQRLREQGLSISPDNFLLAENAVLILPLHRELDEWREGRSGKIGTTKRGIGPAYEDKVGRRALRVLDLADPDTLEQRLQPMLSHHNLLRGAIGLPLLDGGAIADELRAIAPKILPHAAPVWQTLDTLRRQGKRLLFEGAQGVMLDVDHGTYPYVTSSNTVAGQAATGAGIGTSHHHRVLGIAKAYATRVGEGPFPTEQNNDIGQMLGKRGHEFGTVTGRPRRCGWFDAVLVRQAIKTGGIDAIALTKLDVFDGLDSLRICTAYTLDGKTIDRLPASPVLQQRLTPVYETVPGWKHKTFGADSWNDLPAEAIKYVRLVEQHINAPVTLLSTSPDRRGTILVSDPFED